MYFINLKKKQIFSIFSIIIFFTLVINSTFAASDSINVNQQVIGEISCNYNGICEPELGEEAEFCSDCVSSTTSPSFSKPTYKAIPESPEISKCLMINGNNTYTDSLDVVLSISAKKSYRMMISNNSNFSNSFWENYKTEKKWTLRKGEGEKTVYAKFTTINGLVSKTVSDSIIFDITAPSNISDLTAVVGEKQIELKWKNPANHDLKSIRILKSENFFLINPQDRGMIFDRREEFFIDRDVEEGKNYYYTVFAYDYAGNFSSGALIFAGLKIKEKPLETKKVSFEKIPPFEKLTEAPEEEIPLSIKNLTLKDFDFFQEGKKINVLDDNIINIKSEIPLTISIDYEKLPEVLKTIIITLEKPAEITVETEIQQNLLKLGFNSACAENKYFSFLLRINSDKTAYQAIIQPPKSENYLLTVRIVDVKNQVSNFFSGTLKIKEKKQISIPAFLINFSFASLIFLILISIVIISLIWIIVNWIRRKIKTLQEGFSEK